MLTAHPSIILGSYAWSEDLLPRDEFDLRLGGLRGVLEDKGWRSLLVYGDAREHGWLAWLANYIPRMRWALALFSLDRDPLLLVSMSSRDLPAMRRMTWIADVRSGWEWSWFDAWIEAATKGSAATVGFDLITPLLLESVRKSVAGKLVLEAADGALSGARDLQRPREIALVRKAASVCSTTAARILQAYDDGADVESAALAGERKARALAAQDVRTLVSRNGGRTLEPFRAKFDDRPERLLAYVGVKCLGYWSEAFVSSRSSAERRARRSIEAMASEARVGAPLARLAEAGRSALGEWDLHPALNGVLGGRIGLSQCEGELVTPGSVGALKPNVAYALRSGCLSPTEGGAILSATLIAKMDGTVETLMRSPVV